MSDSPTVIINGVDVTPYIVSLYFSYDGDRLETADLSVINAMFDDGIDLDMPCTIELRSPAYTIKGTFHWPPESLRMERYGTDIRLQSDEPARHHSPSTVLPPPPPNHPRRASWRMP